MIATFERWLLRNFDQNDRAHAAHLTGRAVRALLGLFTLAGTITFIGITFRPIVAPHILALWLSAMALVIVEPIVATIVFAIHGPGTERAIRPYVLASRAMSFSLSALIAASVWILLPHAGLPLQCVMLVLYLAFVAMMLQADASPALMIEQGAVTASAIAFVLVYRLPYGATLALVLGAVSVSLIAMHQMAYRSNRAAIEARAETERANAALEAALADVARQRDAKTRFIAVASHDLRQPIQAAALYCEHAVAESDPRLRHRAADGARRAFASVDALLDTMLDHLRVEAGAATARLAPVALDAVIASVIAQQLPAARLANIALTSVRCGQSAVADAAMLSRVLGNLVGNAIRHSRGRRVLLGARPSGDSVLVWVIDDGRGISDADVPHLFDDYVQGRGVAASPGGFGIGLSSAQRMIRLMRGDIAFDPRWRRGAAFSLRLPIVRLDPEVRLWKAA